VVLCFGQLASQLHALTHLSVADDHVALGHQHHTHTVLHVGEEADDNSGAEELDCTIYHTFAGSKGLCAAPGADVSAQSAESVTATLSGTVSPTVISHRRFIRGPPQLS